MLRITKFKADNKGRVLLQVSETTKPNHYLITEFREGHYYTKEVRVCPRLLKDNVLIIIEEPR